MNKNHIALLGILLLLFSLSGLIYIFYSPRIFIVDGNWIEILVIAITKLISLCSLLISIFIFGLWLINNSNNIK